uniref:L1 transposable element RRM domain-containing protein n=1 Tax=Oryzias sinensis TaxID=183150 RepID=A0A8C7Y858_9TELE
MANPRQANVSDHDYDLPALENSFEKEGTVFDGLDSRMDEIQTALKRFDDLEKKLEGIENRMDGIGKSTKENTENIVKLQERVEHLTLENKELREKCLESERYKRRWDLRLMGVPKKDNENTREVVLGILTRVVPMSVEKLRDTVDTVHRLGKRGAVNNNMPRAIIIQFAMCTVRDEVWRKSKEARVCKEMKIYFREDFSKEDRAARAKLWPMVEQARRSGKRAFLKEGYALIDGRKVMLITIKKQNKKKKELLLFSGRLVQLCC